MEEGTFQTLIPSRYISFTLPITTISHPSPYFHAKSMQISVLDSPLHQPINPFNVAAMLVPKYYENDWIFSTEAGHLQLLLSSNGISRLILIGNAQNGDISVGKLSKRAYEMSPFCKERLERSLYPLLRVLLPIGVDEVGKFEVPFLSYEDGVISSVVLERCVGSFVGEMLVEDVEIEGLEREFRRRLRFKRMPNLVQTEICVVPRGVEWKDLVGLSVEEVEFCPDLGKLVHPYLAPMVAGLALVGGHVQERSEAEVRPRALCVGVGGGALLSFLSQQLGFEVVGVEMDEMVLRIAKLYFGLEIGDDIHLCVGDAIEILKNAACIDCKSNSSSLGMYNTGHGYHSDNIDVFRSKFDAVMVDLDSNDSKMGISAPSLEFVEKDVLLAIKSSLSDYGILILNVIPPTRSFYDMLVHELRKAFVDLHEIDCGNGENFVLIASKTSIASISGASETLFVKKLRSLIPEALVDAIRKL